MNYEDKLAIGHAILHNVEKRLIHIKETSKRKAHDREIADVSDTPRARKSKLDVLPQDIQNEILELRSLNMSGVKIAEALEGSLGSLPSDVQDKLVKQGVISPTTHKLKMQPHSITAWAARKGMHGKKRPVKSEDTGRYNITQDQLVDANKQIETLTTENARQAGELNNMDLVMKENVRHRDDKTNLKNKLKGAEQELDNLRRENAIMKDQLADRDRVESDDIIDGIEEGDYGFDGEDEYDLDM